MILLKLILLNIEEVKNACFGTTVFLNLGFNFQDSACNACHDLTMLIVKVRLAPSKKIALLDSMKAH